MDAKEIKDKIRGLRNTLKFSGQSTFNYNDRLAFIDEFLQELEAYALQREMSTKESHRTHFFVVYDYQAKAYRYMETAWSKDEVHGTSFWSVNSEHTTKDLARIECENLNLTND